jgi:hypothetical protein
MDGTMQARQKTQSPSLSTNRPRLSFQAHWIVTATSRNPACTSGRQRRVERSDRSSVTQLHTGATLQHVAACRVGKQASGAEQ